MSIRTSIKVTCVALLPAMMGGCGFVFTHGPPLGHEQRASFSCTESNAGPILDVVWAGLTVTSAISVASNPDHYSYPGAAIGTLVAWAGVSTLAAVTGFGKTKRCKAARQQLGARNAQLRNVGRPQAGGATVQAVVVNPSVYTLAVGQQIQLGATAMSSGGTAIPNKEFSWSSSNNTIASVSSAGLVTANSAGSVTIAAKTENVTGTAQSEVSSQY